VSPAGPPSADIALLIERIGASTVACLGDLMLDRFVHGEVRRISPEAPIPVLLVREETAMPGGVGNVAANLAALGARPRLVSVVGGDGEGSELAALVAGHLGAGAHLMVEEGRPTTVKTRLVAGGQQLLRADRETSAPLAPATVSGLAEALGRALDGAGALVLSDYGKGVLTGEVIAAALEAAAAAGVPVLVDPKGRDFARYRGAAVLTPNRAELAEGSGMPVATDEEVVAAARSVIARAGVGAVVATRGQEGMTVVPADGEPAHVRGIAREVFDVSGAGDTVMAVMAAGLAAGADLRDAAHLANLAGGIVVGKVGTAVVHAEELVAALLREEQAPGQAKIVGAAAAAEEVRRWRRKGWRIGFTNGCFDLLHPGHLSLLRQARAACDRLVVAVNSDASVRRLKGEGRPVQGEAARAMVLAAVELVDLVVVFGEDTPLSLISLLAPDVLVKGADYTVETVVGADLVEGWGGRVLLASLEPGHSTTETIRRLSR
jgi:D-beta-D-heptose 7-phosphate kinase/D-beta-D-heptose 1-phosphate adenosyltransferase